MITVAAGGRCGKAVALLPTAAPRRPLRCRCGVGLIAAVAAILLLSVSIVAAPDDQPPPAAGAVERPGEAAGPDADAEPPRLVGRAIACLLISAAACAVLRMNLANGWSLPGVLPGFLLVATGMAGCVQVVVREWPGLDPGHRAVLVALALAYAAIHWCILRVWRPPEMPSEETLPKDHRVYCQRFTAGHAVPVTPETLLLRYKEILAAILPPYHLAADGLMRLPSGGSEPVTVEHVLQAPMRAADGRRVEARVDFIGDRPLRHRLRTWSAGRPEPLVRSIGDFLEREFPRRTSHLVLHTPDDGILAHEVFHDIQAYLYDHHPQVQERLDEAVRSREEEIRALYAAALTDVRQVFERRWRASYGVDELFTPIRSRSPYYGRFRRVAEEFGWPTLFAIQEPVHLAEIDAARDEIIPTLLLAYVWNDDRVIPILREVFAAAGLNADFDERLRESFYALRPLPVFADAPTAAPPSAGGDDGSTAVEVPRCIVMTPLTAAFPSLPTGDAKPRETPAGGTVCPRCGATTVHCVVTNWSSDGLSSGSWNARPVAIDVLACPADGFGESDGGHAPPRFPLRLSVATTARLRAEAESLARGGEFDDAEMALRRLVNADPAGVADRIALAHVLLDRLKLARLGGRTLPKSAMQEDRDVVAIRDQVDEVLRSVVALQPAPTTEVRFAAARFAREIGDLVAAGEAAADAMHTASPALAETIVRFIDDELSAERPPA